MHLVIKMLASSLIITPSSLTAFAAPFASPSRTHKITLLGALKRGAPTQVSLDLLLKDVPKTHAFKAPKWQEEAPQEFEGVLLSDFVAAYGRPNVVELLVVATNKYASSLLAADWRENGAMLAFRSNGALIPTRNRGTFRVVFDYVRHPKLEQQVYDMKWVWQVESLTFIAPK